MQSCYKTDYYCEVGRKKLRLIVVKEQNTQILIWVDVIFIVYYFVEIFNIHFAP
jgi:hypothetical protein